MELKPSEVLDLTHKEFSMISEENVEKMHDRNEEFALHAIMSAAASRGKGKKGELPSVTDLYKRPTDEDMAKDDKTEEVLREELEHTKEWLSQFDIEGLDFGTKGGN